MGQALARRFGLRQFPMATAVVFVVTAVTSVLGLAVPGVLAALQRTPEGLHGDWWRSVTSLLVQDGGVLGTVSNLAFLLLLGVLAERLVGPGWWLLSYLGAGLAGYAWQPGGAGNSVANCGLAGLLVVAMAAGTVLPRLAPMAVLWWCGALLAGPWGTVPLLVFVAGAATALALLAATDIHGAALAVGILLAAATRPFQRPAVTAG